MFPESAACAERPFDILRPEGGEPGRPPCPLVFASPHSGRCYPPALMAQSVLDEATIRRSEDALVDRLIAGAPAFGAVCLSARYARAYVDLNREPYELDPAMFEDELPPFARARRSPRVAAGLGSIARVVGEGQEIYRGKLRFDDARRRIETIHRPYHQALTELVDQARAAHGVSILIDWHSMPSAPGGTTAGRRVCDIVLGDRFGSACSPRLIRLVEGALEGMGYRVARNTPYAGGYTTEFYGRPERGSHALQVEISRSLYLDESSLQPNAGFERLKRDLDRLCQTLARDWRKTI
ncbi:MAG TPA: N-formylglutamate amidohydrolase [Caulobacteraceae bacterium]|nr:N-formylglutamate amidohydrolase [Caulobacteraceae bacterium]